MKYQTEYQRSFQKRTPRIVDDYTHVERKLHDVPIKRSSSLSPSHNRGRLYPTAQNRNSVNFAMVGPNEKFSESQLYRLRQPVQENVQMKKAREFAILGRNEKFQNNVAYPLRKPISNDSSRIASRQNRHDNHSCGIQTELKTAPTVSFDPQIGREVVPVRSRIGAQSEYQQQFNWKQSLGDVVSDQMLVEDAKVRDRRSDPVLPLSVIDPSEKILIEKSSAPVQPVRIEVDGEKNKHPINRIASAPIAPSYLKRDQLTEYQQRYRPIPERRQPRTRKAFEAEQADERRRKEIANAEHAHSDNEGIDDNVRFGKEFSQKHPHGNLRRWKSEYQTTYKPFWRFDYKNGKWYKDTAVEESGFNPNLFWYKELVSARRRATEYRANAEADHFNRDHTLQLQTGYGGTKGFLAWDTNDDDDKNSVISIDRQAERERQRQREVQRRIDERIQSKIHYQQKENDKPKVGRSDQVVQTNHKVDRVVYVDEPAPRAASVATKALVRNLDSSSIQQHMSWDSESLYSQRTNSEQNFKTQTAKELHRKHYSSDEPDATRKALSTQTHENFGTASFSPLTNENQLTIHSNINDRSIHQNPLNHPSTSTQEKRHAAGRSNHDTHLYDKRPFTRPHTAMNDYQPYRYKDELIDRYINESNRANDYSSVSRSPFQNHLNRLDERFGKTYDTRNRDDDVLSVHSSRSLASSCSLATQTFERAQQNMNKYWGDNSSTKVDSPKNPSNVKN